MNLSFIPRKVMSQDDFAQTDRSWKGSVIVSFTRGEAGCICSLSSGLSFHSRRILSACVLGVKFCALIAPKLV